MENSRPLSKNYSRSSTPNSRCNRSRIFAWTTVISSFVSVRVLSRYVNAYARDFFSAPKFFPSPPLKTSNNSTLASSGSFALNIVAKTFSWLKFSGTIIAMSRVTAGNLSIS